MPHNMHAYALNVSLTSPGNQEAAWNYNSLRQPPPNFLAPVAPAAVWPWAPTWPCTKPMSSLEVMAIFVLMWYPEAAWPLPLIPVRPLDMAEQNGVSVSGCELSPHVCSLILQKKNGDVLFRCIPSTLMDQALQ